MNFSEKISELRRELDKVLLPNISKECIYLDLPYYLNIGDTLIWDGTEEFLNKNNIKCLYKASCDTYKKRQVSSDTTILLQGGGNFGDLWLKHQDFRHKIVKEYPNNKIVILPQTVYYKDINKAISDGIEMGKHNNLTICVRDSRSYTFLKKYFQKNQILLAPDMAFYISETKLNKYRVPEEKDLLFLKRTDKELKGSNSNGINVPRGSEIRDWPTMEALDSKTDIFYKILKINKKTKGVFIPIVDWYCQRILKKHLIKVGVEFVSSYKQVYSTRLHVAILCVLLNKPFTFFDNSYGKNKGFYEAWLNDVDDIKFIFEND